MKDQIKEAIARGESLREAAEKSAADVSRKKIEKETRARLAREAEQHRVSSLWVEENLLAHVEAATARGERWLDITLISRSLTCTDDALASAIGAAGLSVQTSSHEHCDYETGRGEGTYYQTYKAVW